MDLVFALLFACGVSADGFMVGVAYGIQKIRIPIVSLMVVALASSMAVTISMVCGKGIGTMIPQPWANSIGAIMLMVVGFYFFLGACREKIHSLEKGNEEPLLILNIKSLGIIVHILKEPSRADFDSSGIISTREAFFLGTALAMDAMGAGLGAAMTGLNIFFTAVSVGMLKFILVNAGLCIGRMADSKRLKNISALISSIIFIIIGLAEFL